MHKLSLALTNGKNTVYLDKFIRTRYGSKMRIWSVGVFWKFKNVLKNINDSITVGSSTVTFGEGYWTFHIIAEKLEESGVRLEQNRDNNSCKIFSRSDNVNLKNFVPLLGFPVNTVVQANAWKRSPSNIDVNLGLRYVTVECNCVDTDKNFNSAGRGSKVITTVPVTSEQSLNSSVTFYGNIHSEVLVVNGDHGNFEFEVSTNIGKDIDLTLMLEMYIE